MKKFIAFISIAALFYACSSNDKKETKKEEFNSKEFYESAEAEQKEAQKAEHESKGIGKFTDVEIPPTLDKAMSETGRKVYDVKCLSCHKLTDEKVVGPGWKDVTKRRTAEWVMNFVTNTDEMLSKDPAALSMLEECLVRMPNQSISDADARAVYEYMRENDGVK